MLNVNVISFLIVFIMIPLGNAIQGSAMLKAIVVANAIQGSFLIVVVRYFYH